MLPDLAAFAAHALNPGGAMVVLASAEHLPEVLEHLRHPELHWACELDLIFDEPWARLRGKHRLELTRRPLLVFGKNLLPAQRRQRPCPGATNGGGPNAGQATDSRDEVDHRAVHTARPGGLRPHDDGKGHGGLCRPGGGPQVYRFR